jgi:hypothetical protein
MFLVSVLSFVTLEMRFGNCARTDHEEADGSRNHLEQVGVRSRAIERSLGSVEALEYDSSAAITLIEVHAVVEEQCEG